MNHHNLISPLPVFFFLRIFLNNNAWPFCISPRREDDKHFGLTASRLSLPSPDVSLINRAARVNSRSARIPFYKCHETKPLPHCFPDRLPLSSSHPLRPCELRADLSRVSGQSAQAQQAWSGPMPPRRGSR